MDVLAYALNNPIYGIEGLKLLGDSSLHDQYFANDTMFYLVGSNVNFKKAMGEGHTLFYICANAKIIGINVQPYKHLLNPHYIWG
jgi:hypothetical protein